MKMLNKLRNKLNPYIYYETPLGILLNGDCLEIMPLFEDDYFDLCVTSPPYNIGVDYDADFNTSEKGWTDYLDWDDYFKWCEKWIKVIHKTMKDDGRFCLNHYISFGGGRRKKRVAPLMILNEISKNIGFKHHSIAIWKDITLAKKTAWGSWKSASSPYINSPFEGVLFLYKNIWKKKDKGKSTIDKQNFMDLTRGKWDIGTDTHSKTKCSFPISLPTKCINLLSYEKNIIFDPFLGSGTTAVACEKLNRRWVGIEMSEKYCEIAKERIDKEARQGKLDL